MLTRVRITVLLMTAIGGLVALAVGAVLAVTATVNIQNTTELLVRRAALTVALVDRQVDGYFAPALNLIEHVRRLVADGQVRTDDEEQMLTLLRASLAAAPQVAGVVFWRPDGDGVWVTHGTDGAVATHPAELPTPRWVREVLAAARADGAIRWGEPLVRYGLPVMTASGALYQDGRFAGALGAGLSLIGLSQVLPRAAPDPGMRPFVLYGGDRVLAHPALLENRARSLVTETSPLLGLDEIGDPVLAALPGLERDDVPDDAGFEVRRYLRGTDASEVVLSRTTTEFGPVPLTVGVHVPSAVVNQQMRRLIWSVVAGLALLALAVVAALFLASRISRPILAISAAATRIAELDVAEIPPLPPSRIAELDEQSRAFNRMVSGLRWFEAYVPRQLVSRLMRAEGDAGIGQREAVLTVMFCDIVGFTSVSESMPPAEVTDFLNRHFEMVSRCIEAEGGTLDKYIGDAAMAFWGAPEKMPDHAARACRAALRMLAESEARMAAGERPPIRIKIAIHTGPLIVGNIGARNRMNYTVIGDTVNVASRIEKVCSAEDDGSPAIVLVSGETMRAAGEGFRFEALGAHRVKGRHEAVDVWRLWTRA